VKNVLVRGRSQAGKTKERGSLFRTHWEKRGKKAQFGNGQKKLGKKNGGLETLGWASRGGRIPDGVTETKMGKCPQAWCAT